MNNTFSKPAGAISSKEFRTAKADQFESFRYVPDTHYRTTGLATFQLQRHFNPMAPSSSTSGRKAEAHPENLITEWPFRRNCGHIFLVLLFGANSGLGRMLERPLRVSATLGSL
jgi:hypothetical protein